MQFVLQNQSTVVTAAQTQWIADAVAQQIRDHVAPAWDRQPATVSTSGPGFPVVILDNADQAGALGYHDETPSGQIYARVFAATTLHYELQRPISGPQSDSDVLRLVAPVVSHEVLETYIDPNVDLWADAGNGTNIAVELGDPVESDAYQMMPSGVWVTNFITSAWADPAGKPGTLDHLGKLTAPFSLDARGYMIVESAGQVRQVYGAGYPEEKKDKSFPAARTARRIAKAEGRKL